MVEILKDVITSEVSGAVLVELSVDSGVGGANVSDLPRVARLGFGVGIFVDTRAGRPVGVSADTGNGAFVPPVVWEGVSLGNGVIVVVGNVVAVVGFSGEVVVVDVVLVVVVEGCTVVVTAITIAASVSSVFVYS